MVERHERIVKVLLEMGGTINAGDVGHFACTAVEKNNLALLKEIVQQGGDITLPRATGTSALHVAVCEGNIEIVKYLLEQGADFNKHDMHSWSAKDLADQQGHEDIKALFRETRHERAHIDTSSSVPILKTGIRFLERLTSEPNIRPLDVSFRIPETRPIRKTNNFDNSLFGLLASQNNLHKTGLEEEEEGKTGNPVRVTISCAEKDEVERPKLVLLPKSFKELLELSLSKFGIVAAKVMSKENNAEIDDLDVIRDGDHLLLATKSHHP